MTGGKTEDAALEQLQTLKQRSVR